MAAGCIQNMALNLFVCDIGADIWHETCLYVILVQTFGTKLVYM